MKGVQAAQPEHPNTSREVLRADPSRHPQQRAEPGSAQREPGQGRRGPAGDRPQAGVGVHALPDDEVAGERWAGGAERGVLVYGLGVICTVYPLAACVRFDRGGLANCTEDKYAHAYPSSLGISKLGLCVGFSLGARLGPHPPAEIASRWWTRRGGIVDAHNTWGI